MAGARRGRTESQRATSAQRQPTILLGGDVQPDSTPGLLNRAVTASYPRTCPAHRLSQGQLADLVRIGESERVNGLSWTGLPSSGGGADFRHPVQRGGDWFLWLYQEPGHGKSIEQPTHARDPVK